MQKNLTLITSFFESPYHQNRAPYNEQLFYKLKSAFDIKIIRPIAWTDIISGSSKLEKKEYYKSQWNEIPILYPTYYFLPKYGLPYNGLMYYLSMLNAFKLSKSVPDIFYTTWAYPDAYATMILAKKVKRKYIVRVHGSDINDLAFRSVIQDKIKMVLENASAVISPSNALKEKMLQLDIPAEKIKVIYSGIDKEKFYSQDREQCEKQLSLNTGMMRILYIGNFKRAKGVMDLLKSTFLLKNDLKNFEVVFIGKGEDESDMKQYIAENKLENCTRIVGPVDHHNLNPWINSSDCVCLPSYAEGMPNVLLEAIACETKIVATNVGGIPEIYQDDKDYFVEPGDTIALRNRLYQIITGIQPVKTASIPIKSYDDIAEQITEIIDEILLNNGKN